MKDFNLNASSLLEVAGFESDDLEKINFIIEKISEKIFNTEIGILDVDDRVRLYNEIAKLPEYDRDMIMRFIAVMFSLFFDYSIHGMVDPSNVKAIIAISMVHSLVSCRDYKTEGEFVYDMYNGIKKLDFTDDILLNLVMILITEWIVFIDENKTQSKFNIKDLN